MARLIVQTPEGQQAIELRRVNSLGRHPNNSIQLLDKILSKEHCIIELRGTQFWLRDLGSLNGTFINNERVRGEVPLSHGDEISLGKTRARFEDTLASAALPAVASPPENINQPFADRLLAEGQITAEDHRRVCDHAIRMHGRVEDALIELGVISEADLLKYVSTLHNTRFVSSERLANAAIEQRVIGLISREMARKHGVFPVLLDVSSSILSVVTADPDNHTALHEVKVATAVREVRALVARPAAVHAAIARHYFMDVEVFDRLLSARASAPLNDPLAASSPALPSLSSSGASPTAASSPGLPSLPSGRFRFSRSAALRTKFSLDLRSAAQIIRPSEEFGVARRESLDSADVPSSVCLNAWFPDHPSNFGRLLVDHPARLCINLGPPHIPDGAGVMAPLEPTAIAKLAKRQHVDVLVLAAGARVTPLRQKMPLPPDPGNVLCFNITPNRPGILNIEVALLVRNEPIHRTGMKALAIASRDAQMEDAP